MIMKLGSTALSQSVPQSRSLSSHLLRSANRILNSVLEGQGLLNPHCKYGRCWVLRMVQITPQCDGAALLCWYV